jgi:hypothetical protein
MVAQQDDGFGKDRFFLRCDSYRLGTLGMHAIVGANLPPLTVLSR